MLLSPRAFNLWLPHWSRGCGSCISCRNHDAGPALQKPLAGWCGNRTPAQSRVQLRDHMPHLSLTQSGTTPVPHELWTLVPYYPVLVLSKCAFLPTRAVKAFLSHILGRFTMAPRATFPSCFLTTPAERGIYLRRQWGCALYCPLDFESPPIAQALTNSCP